MFERPHHQRIAQVLNALNAPLLKENRCYFGGGTAIALRYGEYRESIDIDFLVSDMHCYRNLRQLLLDSAGINTIMQSPAHTEIPTTLPVITQLREVRADQYGIRTMLAVAEQAIKFEIILEGRVALAVPTAKDTICGLATLTPLDMATSKLLANSDRWNDDGVFNRDVIDLAMMKPSLALLRQALSKAADAYGPAVQNDLGKALDRLQTREGWLERCLQALAITLPKAVIWQHLRALRRALR